MTARRRSRPSHYRASDKPEKFRSADVVEATRQFCMNAACEVTEMGVVFIWTGFASRRNSVLDERRTPAHLKRSGVQYLVSR